MSLIKQIYKAPVNEKIEDFITVSITVNGKEFYGWAHCHPDDKEFCSRKVGTTIAHMRATITALKYQRNEAHYEYKVLKKAFFDAHQNIPDDLSVNNPFRTALWQAENRYHKYQKPRYSLLPCFKNTKL